ncbi:MAG: WYL domain-containing transcriptional regulator [Ignavibacteria bacterium]|nr:WYL domain-containing transcriptional regulator [Ignavibacteria bacterium]
MQDIRSKLKRQIEILGLILSQNIEGIVRTFDLADIFNVEELTIRRDMRDLRSFGIMVHSTKRNGVCLTGNLNEDKLSELITQYMALCTTPAFVEKSTSLLIKRLGEKSLANITLLQKCIEENRCALVDYIKETDELEFRQEVCPVLIFQRDNYWRLLAVKNDKIKQYHLNKIVEVRPLDKKFRKISDDRIRDVFRYSWKTWIGDKSIDIKLLLEEKWAKRIKPKQLMDYERFIELDNGSVIYETTVNSLEEVASWIVSRGAGIIVLEPEELKEKVISLARDTLSNYDFQETYIEQDKL